MPPADSGSSSLFESLRRSRRIADRKAREEERSPNHRIPVQAPPTNSRNRDVDVAVLHSREIPRGTVQHCSTFPTVQDVVQLEVNGTLVPFKLGRKIHSEYGLTARGTTVFEATSDHPDFVGQELIIKSGWPRTSRQSEVDILQYTCHKILRSKNYKYLLNHLPRIYAAQDFNKISGPARIALTTALGVAPISMDAEDRVLRVIVMDKLHPITELNLKDFTSAFRDAMHCHHQLHTKYKTLHCDTRKMRREDSLPDPNNGTIPFLAIARLKSPSSLYTPAQDSESFFWTLLVIATCIISPANELLDGPISVVEFLEHDARRTMALKLLYLERFRLDDETQIQATKKFKRLEGVLRLWGERLYDAYWLHPGRSTGTSVPYKVIETYFEQEFGAYQRSTELLPELRYF